jgi:hypothetical protein
MNWKSGCVDVASAVPEAWRDAELLRVVMVCMTAGLSWAG